MLEPLLYCFGMLFGWLLLFKLGLPWLLVALFEQRLRKPLDAVEQHRAEQIGFLLTLSVWIALCYLALKLLTQFIH